MNEVERVRKLDEMARHLMAEAHAPEERLPDFIERARELLAIAENQRMARKPNPLAHPERIGPEGEPIEPLLAVENAGEFPTLTDQGEEATFPSRRHLKR